MVSENHEKLTIALDMMGGDYAPDAMLEGADRALGRYSNIAYLLFGRQEVLEAKLKQYPKLAAVSELCHAETVVASDEKPSIALRQGKKSSMRLAIDSVKEGKAHAVVSAGNTGALMAMAKIVLRPLPGIARPAITSIMPTKKGRTVFLDLGANIECDAENLVQFALMGDAFARAILELEQPSIGLLNVGSEEMKGHEELRVAAERLRSMEGKINFYGYVEGDDLASGIVDVVVTDGFTGNIALKTAEGTAKLCGAFTKAALTGSLVGRIGALFAGPALKRVFKKLDPRLHNGAMFVGLNGIAVKSHGGSDAIGNANAIGVAYELYAHQINEQIIKELALHETADTDNEYGNDKAQEAD